MPIIVSLVIPIRNRSALFQETVDSLKAQTLTEWEGIVVDDGSGPIELEQIRKLTDSDPRLRLLQNARARRGACAARNTGLAAARGEYVIFLDSDDLLAPRCLERRVQVMEQNPRLDFAVFLTRAFRKNAGDSPEYWNRFTDESDLDRFLRADAPWQTAGPIWRRSSLDPATAWDERVRSWQDWEFHIRTILAGKTYLKVAEPDTDWRMATAAGSIDQTWTDPRQIINRVRTFSRIFALLKNRAALTDPRKKTMATLYFLHAFRLQESRHRALIIWRRARRDGVIGPGTFLTVWIAEITSLILRRFNERRFSTKIGRRHVWG